MKSRTLIIIFLVIIVLISITSFGGIYYLNQQVSETEKENEDLEKELKKLKAQNKEANAKIQELEEKLAKITGPSSKRENKTNETDLIRQAIISKIKSEGAPGSDSEVTDIKYKNNWATGWAQPYNPSMEGALFVLQKIDGKWEVIDYGSGLVHSDYPSSPSELWPEWMR